MMTLRMFVMLPSVVRQPLSEPYAQASGLEGVVLSYRLPAKWQHVLREFA